MARITTHDEPEYPPLTDADVQEGTTFRSKRPLLTTSQGYDDRTIVSKGVDTVSYASPMSKRNFTVPTARFLQWASHVVSKAANIPKPSEYDGYTAQQWADGPVMNPDPEPTTTTLTALTEKKPTRKRTPKTPPTATPTPDIPELILTNPKG